MKRENRWKVENV